MHLTALCACTLVCNGAECWCYKHNLHMLLQRTWDVISNTSSEPSEAAGNAYGGANMSVLPQSVTGSGQQQGGQRLGSAELRQLAWSKGVPPTGKKKKDPAANRAVFGRLV